MADIHRRNDMANQQHLVILNQGKATWNKWRKQHPEIRPDLSGANLSEADLSGADLGGANLNNAHLTGADLSGADLSNAHLSSAELSEANLSRANLRGAHLINAGLSEANLSRANLSRAYLISADLSEADLSEADLSEADLSEANLSRANLSEANLSRADLRHAILIRTNFTKAILTHCQIYGISVWDVQLQEAEQNSLVITHDNQPTITVDQLEVAQFIYLLLNNAKIRDVINVLTTKAILILGRFTPERKIILESIGEALRKQGYLPILFDFDRPSSQTVREAVGTLAHLSHFIIADLTDPSSVPEELETIIPALAVPVQPIIEASKREFSMFKGYGIYHWVLETYKYTDCADLLANIHEKVIEPATQKACELQEKKRELDKKPR